MYLALMIILNAVIKEILGSMGNTCPIRAKRVLQTDAILALSKKKKISDVQENHQCTHSPKTHDYNETSRTSLTSKQPYTLTSF